ncbi:MAG: glutamine synthetase, partial [Pseudomonadota bacterium]
MSVEDALARARAEHPAAAGAEVYATDLNGVARGKLVPAEVLGKLGAGAMKMPISTLALDIFSTDVPETGLAIERGDPDGVMLPVAETVAPMLWAGRPTLQVQCM